MGRPQKKEKLTNRESSILRRKDDRNLLPWNPYLLQYVVRILLRRIEQLDTTKDKNKAKEARALLWLMARHEDIYLDNPLQLLFIGPIPPWVESMGLSQTSKVPWEHEMQERIGADIDIGQTLIAKSEIKRQLQLLNRGKGKARAIVHGHMPESVILQHKIVSAYIENNHPLPDNFDKKWEGKMQTWIDRHAKQLMRDIINIPCSCNQTIPKKKIHLKNLVDTKFTGKLTQKNIINAMLACLHDEATMGTMDQVTKPSLRSYAI